MRRVVVTGLGVGSSIGNNAAEVTESLKAGKSGIEFMPQYKELGFRSQVAGTLKLNPEELVDRRLMRFMGNGSAYAYLAMKEAIADAGLGEKPAPARRRLGGGRFLHLRRHVLGHVHLLLGVGLVPVVVAGGVPPLAALPAMPSQCGFPVAL